MKRTALLLPSLLMLVAVATPAGAGKDAGDYVTAAGQLKEVLEVKDLQQGFAGTTGTSWKVEKDGQWKKYQVFNLKLTEKESGKLAKAELTQLGKELAKYDLLGLKDAGKAMTNPHTVAIQFGKHSSKLLTQGGSMPKPDTTSVEGRYAGILEATKTLLKAKKNEEK